VTFGLLFEGKSADYACLKWDTDEKKHFGPKGNNWREASLLQLFIIIISIQLNLI
jgi:hypothetical protein